MNMRQQLIYLLIESILIYFLKPFNNKMEADLSRKRI